MKVFYSIICFLFLLCFITFSSPPKKNSKESNTIGLQPLGIFDTTTLHKLQKELTAFFNQPVVILSPIKIPKQFVNFSKGERYSADSLLALLNTRVGAFSQIVGLTHKDIFTTKLDENGNIKEPAYKYKVWGIFGLGYCPGKASVISDFRLKTNDLIKSHRRLKIVIIHELGHNLELEHCPNAYCIMNDANEKISSVDNSGNDYCTECKTKLKK